MHVPSVEELTPELSPVKLDDLMKRARGYPKRFIVPAECIPWSVPYGGYYRRRPVYTAPVVLAHPSWAHPEVVDSQVQSMIRSYFPLKWDNEGLPLNPAGRTGLGGRGDLGKWGANPAADPIITYSSPDGSLYLLAILRSDCRQLALPGGMCEADEKTSATLQRELQEETNATLNMSDATIVFCGYVPDPRNTDHAWMETTASHSHIDYEVAMSLPIKAGDDAAKVSWQKLTPQLLHGGMYANHGMLLQKALSNLARRDSGMAQTVAALHC